MASEKLTVMAAYPDWVSFALNFRRCGWQPDQPSPVHHEHAVIRAFSRPSGVALGGSHGTRHRPEEIHRSAFQEIARHTELIAANFGGLPNLTLLI
jgi:hypothetical protein